MNEPVFGQTKLLSILDNYTIETLPKTLCFLGKRGCGKRYLANHLAERLELELISIDKDHLPTASELSEYQISPLYRLYVIDLRGLLDKDQNMFLKFIEEPSMYMHIVVVANSSFEVLPTILNRCIKYTFAPYEKADLEKFSWMHPTEISDLYYKICDTPGLFIYNAPATIDSLYNEAKSLYNSMCTVEFPAFLSFYTRLNFKEDYNKYDPELFLTIMHEIGCENNTEFDFKVCDITTDYLYQLATIPTLVKEYLITSYLIDLWEMAHDIKRS